MGDARFTPAVRLTRKADFKRVFARPEKSGSRFFTVLYRTSEQSHARLGMAISRRSARRAVARNRIKRTIRESFRRRRCTLRPLDIVVIGRSGADRASNAELFAVLERHWTQLSRPCGPSC